MKEYFDNEIKPKLKNWDILKVEVLKDPNYEDSCTGLLETEYYLFQ